LRRKIEEMWSHPFDYKAIANTAQERYSSDRYVDDVVHIYKNVNV